jgi:hypothetical protein
MYSQLGTSRQTVTMAKRYREERPHRRARRDRRPAPEERIDRSGRVNTWTLVGGGRDLAARMLGGWRRARPTSWGGA